MATMRLADRFWLSTRKRADKFKKLRLASGLTQRQLAARADLSYSLIIKLERGARTDVRVSIILALAEAMGCHPGDLLTVDEDGVDRQGDGVPGQHQDGWSVQ